ncbi:MAG: DUF4124 domain-containing protein [Sedimenticola sp.]|nr:DUF4124 domain-containing protein [Sedimenticola sp.]
MRTLFFLSLLMLAFASHSAIYKWVDSRGEVHYSDTPTRDAEQIKLSDPTIYTPTGSESSAAPARENASTPTLKPLKYSSFVIVAPGNNETVQANDGTVTIQFEIQPGLQAGHYIAPVVDGRILNQRVTAPVLVLEGVERGSHMVHASIHNAAGLLQARSNIVQFFVQQTSVVEEGKSPDLPDSGSSGESGVDAPQYTPGAAPGYTPGTGSDFKADPTDSTPGQTNSKFNSSSKPISSTPGQSNPAFTPKY